MKLQVQRVFPLEEIFNGDKDEDNKDSKKKKKNSSVDRLCFFNF